MARITLKSDNPGMVWQVLKQPGDAVAEDEPVILLELMKMEVPVVAQNAGRVVELLVAPQDTVEEDQPIAVIETE